MPKYMIEAAYTADGMRGVQKDKASGRLAAASRAVQSLGGKLEAMYFCFGEYDAVLIADLPDNVSAAAIGLTTSASGLVRTRTTPLLTIEEIYRALAKTVKYRAPGKK